LQDPLEREDIVGTTILKEADELIHGERAQAYGSALANAQTWATLFTAATGIQVEAEHYPISQICCKLARERSKHKEDNWRDIAGYVGVWGKIKAEQDMIQKGLDRGIVLPSHNQGIS